MAESQTSEYYKRLQLRNLKITGSLFQFVREFDELANSILDLHLKDKVTTFISVLPTLVQDELLKLELNTFEDYVEKAQELLFVWANTPIKAGVSSLTLAPGVASGVNAPNIIVNSSPFVFLHLRVVLLHTPALTFFDTGSGVNLIDHDFANLTGVRLQGTDLKIFWLNNEVSSLATAIAPAVPVRCGRYFTKQDFYLIRDLSSPIILGQPWIGNRRWTIDKGRKAFFVNLKGEDWVLPSVFI